MSAPVGVWLEHRDHLRAVAYRMLGSIADADDVLQDAYLRLQRTDLATLDDPRAWLTTVVSRLCLDRLRSASARREAYVGPWLPEPLVADATTDPADEVELAESLSLAFLVVLESLSPAERVALLLHDVFGHGYGDLARVLDRSEDACRQLVSRARRHVDEARPRFETDRAVRDRVVGEFLDACVSGEMDRLLELLAPDAVHVSDGGGLVSAARHPVLGAERVARLVLGLLDRVADDDLEIRPAEVNGTLGAVLHLGGAPYGVVSFEVVGGRIARINLVVHPAKVRAALGHAG